MMATEPIAKAGEDELRERLFADWFAVREAHPDHYIHVVLDPNHPVAHFDALHPDHLLKRQPTPNWKRIERPDLKHDPDICPLLITVFSPGDHGYPDEALLNETIDRALERCASVNGAYVCGWVATASDVSEAASRIAVQCVVANPLNGRKVLPWFEPHRLALLTEDCADVLDRMLEGFTRWWFVDAAGTVRRVSISTVDAVLPAPVSVQRAHALWAAQERIADARRVLMGLRKAGLGIPERPEAVLDALIKLANDQGLRGQQDVILFVLNCLTLSSTWYEHPSIQRALHDISEGGEGSLADAIAAQSDVVLDEIASYGTEQAQPSMPLQQ